MNPWLREEHNERVGDAGALFVHPDFPEWQFFIRPLNDYNVAWPIACARVSRRPEYTALVKRREEPGYEATASDAEIERNVTRDAFAEAGVASWSGVCDRDGAAMKCTPRNALRIFDRFPRLADAALAFAANPANFAPPSDGEKAVALAGN